MIHILFFIGTFIVVFLIYQFIFIKPAKKRGKKITKKNKDKELIEISYLKNRYKLDIKKVNYNQLLQIIAIVSSLDITIIVTIVSFIKNIFLLVLVGIFLSVIVIYVSYHLVYLFYKKKGMIKNV